ncbi:unnamed protein product [Phaedon cochleariae]|uniref:Protein NDUFAF4 homolog n=1 Tax=Phaedon cochleariae TaxID=80249 RepID=A0A9P0DEY5_PHACE|nr:unnamed protein product [Phaedon cochleariae]
MGKAFSMISNPFRNFNVESRAHKIISQPKPIPAPRHEKDEADLQRLIKEFPKVYQDSLKKNEQLDKHLKEVFVTSREPNVNIKQEYNLNRPLPMDRTNVGPFLYGVKEPENIPIGKTTLGKVMELITKHQSDPKAYNSKRVSEELAIPGETAKNILKYVRVFEVYIPQERETKAKFAGPSLPKVQVLKQLRKQLPPPNPKEKEKT